MKNNYIVIPNNLNNINDLLSEGINTFLFPVEKYSIGYNTFSIDDINSLKCHKYLYINRLLKTEELEELKESITSYQDIDGIFFEDMGVYEILKDKYKMINYNNHFNTNYHAINTYLEMGMDSVVVSNDITKEEIEEIINKAIKPVVVFTYGKTNIMYSRRNLISCYNDYHHCHENNPILTEEISKVEFAAKESDLGTVMFDNNYYNGSILISEMNSNILFYLINLVDLNDNEVISVIKDLKDNNIDHLKSIKENTNYGFLYKKTIYKVKGDNL